MRNLKQTKLLLAFALLMVGCTSHDWPVQQKKAAPISDVKATSVNPGEIVISWKLDEAKGDADRIGVLATYFDPIQNTKMERMAAANETSVVIPNTAKVAGEYTFVVRSVSSSGQFGKAYTLTATSLPMTKQYTPSDFRDIPLTVDMVTTNAQEWTEGPIENLVDEDVNNYFHSDWHGAWQELHYIQVDLKDDSHGGKYLRFGYVPRPKNSSGAPKVARILTSADGNTWSVAAEATNYGLPAMTGDRKDGDYFLMPKGARYIRFVPLVRHDGVDLQAMLGIRGASFFHMGELYLSQSYGQDVYDPEVDVKKQIDAYKHADNEKK